VENIIYFYDRGIGTEEKRIKEDVEICKKVSKILDASYIFVTVNRGVKYRLYKGDPSDPLSAKRVSPFVAAIEMPDPNDILVVATEPILTKRGERGTPRPVLYTIFSYDSLMELTKIKELVAKSAVWLCKHSWISPSAPRLVTPLFFANKLSRLVSNTRVRVSPDDMEIPIFL
jgi:hypothetical protein